jgi:RNA polymerase sigma-70 factor (ECF subfamily)
MSLEWATQLNQIMELESDTFRQPGVKPGHFDDQSLIRQILEQGSRAHFRLLIERHQKHVFDLVCSVLGPRYQAAAEDVSQEVFIKIHRKLNTFRGDSGFATWAYRIAYNTALDKLRALKRHGPENAGSETLDQRQDSGPGPAETLATQQDDAQMRAAVEQLPELYQTLIHLHYWRGLTIVEIAALLESKTGTIKSYLHRARERLSQTLGASA